MKHMLIILILPFLNACTLVGIDNGPMSTLKLLAEHPNKFSGDKKNYDGYQRYLWDLRHGQAKPIGSYHISNVFTDEDLQTYLTQQKSRRKTHRHWVGSNGYTYTTYSHTYSGGYWNDQRNVHWDDNLGVFRKKLFSEE